MFTKIKKFPFGEFLLLIFTNILITILSITNVFFFCFALGDFNGIPPIDLVAYLILGITINIFLPFGMYISVCYLSQNKILLRFWAALNSNQIYKILICALLFLISPIPLAILASSEICLIDLILNFPLSMGFPLMLFFIFEPIVTQMVGKHFEKHPNSKSWLKKNYDLRMEIQKELEGQ